MPDAMTDSAARPPFRAAPARLAALAALAAMALLGVAAARAESVVDAWNRVERNCASIDAFLATYKSRQTNPFLDQARQIRADLNCAPRPGPSPTTRPTSRPTPQPTSRPTARPTSRPSARPSSQPTSQPTGRPSPPPQFLPPPTNQTLAVQAFDRREYRRALDVFALACNTDRDGYSCQQTAVMLSKAKDYALGEPNFPMARTYFERACDLQPTAAYCNNARLVNSWAHYGPIDPARAYAYFQRSGLKVGDLDCKGNSATTCEVLGRGFIGAGRDAVTSSILFNMACDGGDARGCFQAGDYATRGLAQNRPADVQDYLRAEAYYRRACDARLVEACDRGIAMRASRTYGILDPGLARQFFTQSGRNSSAVDCRLPTNEVCYNLGLAFSMAQYGAPQPYLADAFFARACDVDHPVACRMVGIKLQEVRNHRGAAEKFVKGCKGDDGPSCLSAGKLYAWSAFPLYNLAEAQKLMRRACTLGISEGCSFRAW